MLALLLDLSNILGGFLLAIGLLRRLPSVGDDLQRFAARLAPFGWIVGIVALVVGGWFVIVHLTSGPRLLHYEVVGVAVGVLLLWDRLGLSRRTGKTPPQSSDQGAGLVLAVFGVIAVIVGVQGIFTPN
ncbi:MAG: hypothetical protein EON88_07815 [Brevundimonas sp.]|nr:MAG: hypothetical protein EON88_07815 [Brevundimonas sp.]